MRRLIARLLFWPTFCYNALMGRVLKVQRWWDRIDDHVLLGALPFAADVPRLYAAGVRGVINMCDEYAGPLSAYQQMNIQQLRLPTTDYVAPSLSDIQRGMEFIQQHAARGDSVYVHCKAGRGRGPTLVACWLIVSQDLTPDEAQAVLAARRPQVNRGVGRRAVVREFYNRRFVSRDDGRQDCSQPQDAAP